MMDSNRRRLLGFAGGAAALSALKPLHGQEKFPSKPIEVVTHAGVGGGTDITARMMMVHAPGVFKTDLNAAILEGPRGQEFLLRTPMKRFGRLEELVGAAVYLASDASTFVTGQFMVVDGGFLASGVNQ